MNKPGFLFLIFCCLLTLCLPVAGQSRDTLNVDKAFFRARQLAFSGKREEAKSLCKRILRKSPGYSDVEVLLGRIYLWSDQYDSARYVLRSVLKQKPYEDAYIALADLERWDHQAKVSLGVAREGLIRFPGSRDLLLRKARAVEDTGGARPAYQLVDSLLQKDRRNTELRTYAESLKRKASVNKIGINYTYDYFDKRYSDPWHLVSVSYSRQTALLGSVIGRVNYANRFQSGAYQAEIDMYPGLGKKMYSYLNFGYSESGLFPHYRGGVSVYRSLPRSFEAELGIRYLQFSSATIIYTGSIGKYYRSFWFSVRPFFVKTNYNQQFSQSYSLIIRYYFGSADDYFGLTVGTGVSPDDRSRQTLLENPSLHSGKIYLSYQKRFARRYIFNASVGVLNEEFIQGSTDRGNDYNFSIGLEKIF